MKHVFSYTDDLKQQIRESDQGIPKETLQHTWEPFHRDCRSVLNGKMVTYKVSYSNSNDSYEFKWTWNVSASVNPHPANVENMVSL